MFSVVATVVVSSYLIRPNLCDLSTMEVRADRESGGRVRRFLTYETTGVALLMVHEGESVIPTRDLPFGRFGDPIRLQCSRGLPFACFEYRADLISGKIENGIPISPTPVHPWYELKQELAHAAIPTRPLLTPLVLNVAFHSLFWAIAVFLVLQLRRRIDLERWSGWAKLGGVSLLGGLSATLLCPLVIELFVQEWHYNSPDGSDRFGDAYLGDLQIRWRLSRFVRPGSVRYRAHWNEDGDWPEPRVSSPVTFLPAWGEFLRPDASTPRVSSRTVVARGWPCLSFWGGFEAAGEGEGIASRRGAIVRPEDSLARRDSALIFAELTPYMPIWPGLIWNTLFYSAIAAFVLAHLNSPLVMRQIRRCVKGQCLGCGYDVRNSFLHCPECGRNLRDALKVR